MAREPRPAIAPINFSFRVLAPIPSFDAEPGDSLVIGLEREYPVSLVRHFHDVDAIAGVLLSGALRLMACSDGEGTTLRSVTHEQAARAIVRHFPTPVPRLQLLR
jgi:hypothetical protein